MKGIIKGVITTMVLTLLITMSLPVEATNSFSRTGQLEIHSISGGYGVKAIIDNNGGDLEDVLWKIEFEAFVFINGVTDGIIENFPDHSSKTIRTGFLFGTSPGFVRVTVWKGDDSIYESRNCLVLGPFVLLLS